MTDCSKDYLMHYGVLGMKWGVHRAERRAADGTRVSKKLAKYREAEESYNKSKSDVKSARQLYKNSKNPDTKQAYNEAKSRRRIARANLNKAYFKVKNANSWEKGKQLHAEGKRIEEINRNQRIADLALWTAGVAGSQALRRSNKFVSNRSNLRYSDLAALPGAAAMITSGAMHLRGESQKRKLRAYYYG